MAQPFTAINKARSVYPLACVFTLVAAMVSLMPSTGLAAIGLVDGVAYTQDFDSMTSTVGSATVITPNPPADWVFTGGARNYGTDSERALGQGGASVPEGFFGASFQILTGGQAVDLAIAYTGEQWYYGGINSTSKIINFAYSRDATSLTTDTWTEYDPLDFDGPVNGLPLGAQTTDGNAAQFRTDISGTVSLSGVTNNDIVWIRWFGSNSGDGLAVDDFSITATAVTDPNPLTGDLNNDGFVGIADLNIVLGAWNQNVPPGNPLADPSGDNFVGIEDLNTVLGNWNAGTAPGSGTNTPEPTTALLAGLGLAWYGCVRGNKRR